MAASVNFIAGIDCKSSQSPSPEADFSGIKRQGGTVRRHEKLPKRCDLTLSKVGWSPSSHVLARAWPFVVHLTLKVHRNSSNLCLLCISCGGEYHRNQGIEALYSLIWSEDNGRRFDDGEISICMFMCLNVISTDSSLLYHTDLGGILGA